MDKREFQKSLEAYYREKGKHPPPLTPYLAGRPISLHILFERVTKLGGSYILSNEDRWQDILQVFNLSPPSASLAYGLRKIYKDYLESFEKLQLYGEEPTDVEDDKNFSQLEDISEGRRREDSEYRSARRKSDRNSSQYAQDEHYRSIFRPEPPEWRLINSLRSCLPNEVNFIINTLLLYCSDHHKGKRLKLERCPHLLDILMLHAGCPKQEDMELYQRWKLNSNLFLTEYWEEKLDCEDLKPLLGLEKRPASSQSENFINGESDREGQRIRHILVIIRNICQDQRDVHFIRRSELVLKFLLRCSFIENDIGLVEQALETISIILQVDKTDKNMEPPVWSYDPYTSLIVELICRLITRNDKMILIRILEIYTSLLEQTVVEENSLSDGGTAKQSDLASFLSNAVPDISDKIVPFLTLPDCELVIATLEALNALAKSPLGVVLLKNESISLLVDLLSFSSRNYDISGSRFYGPRLQEITHQPLAVVPRIARRIIPSSGPQNSNISNRVPVTPQMHNHVPPPPQISTQSKPLPPKRPNQPVPQSQTVQEDQNATQTHAIQFCKKFLQSRIELTDDTALVPRSGIFLEYQAMAKQDGQKNGVSGIPILTIPEFTRLIREMFPTSQLINDAQSRQVFSGIKIKPKEDMKPSVKSKPNGVVPNGNGVPDDMGKANGKALPNGVRPEVNGISHDEDSNHSQQSLDSVGGSKPPHLANNLQTSVKDETSDQPIKKPDLNENGIHEEKVVDDKTDVKIETDQQQEVKVSRHETPTVEKDSSIPGYKRPAFNEDNKTVANEKLVMETKKRNPISQSASGPSAGLRVLLQNAGSFLFDDFTDDREDCLTRSIRIQSALVLLSLAEQSNAPAEPSKKKRRSKTPEESCGLILVLLKRYEQRISLIAASRQDASPVLARLLSFMP